MTKPFEQAFVYSKWVTTWWIVHWMNDLSELFEQADVSNKQAAKLFKQMTKAVQTEANNVFNSWQMTGKQKMDTQ